MQLETCCELRVCIYSSNGLMYAHSHGFRTSSFAGVNQSTSVESWESGPYI